jgi:hypothetical protein
VTVRRAVRISMFSLLAAAGGSEVLLFARDAARKRAKCVGRCPAAHVFRLRRDLTAVPVAERVGLTAFATIERPLFAARAFRERATVPFGDVTELDAIGRRGVRHPNRAGARGGGPVDCFAKRRRARVTRRVEHFAEAAALAEQAATAARSAYGVGSCRTVEPLRLQAEALVANHRAAEALPFAEAALAASQGTQIDPRALARIDGTLASARQR